MKKRLIIPAIFATSFIPAMSYADLFYAALSTSIGVQNTNDTNFSTSSYGAALGLDLPIVRAEVEYNYLAGSKDNRDSDAHLAMVNAYIDFIPTPIITPYFGIGIGSFFGGEIDSYDISSRIAYQAMLGLEFSLPATALYIDLEFRGLYSFDVLPEYIDKNDVFLGDIRLKLRYSF